jgi:FAD/FMN-containing dehydrogenase/Fe-S oxidoreductase
MKVRNGTSRGQTRWTPEPRDGDLRAVAHELGAAIEGEVRFGAGDRAMYAYDASVYRVMPMGVVIPKSDEDVVQALDICRKHGLPIYGRGCGTSLAGQCCNHGVVFDFSKYMHGIVDLDVKNKTAELLPGTICDTLVQAAAKHGLMWGVEPQTHDHCTFGGMIGNNSCGTYSVLVGKTVDNVLGLDVLTYDGLRMRVGKTSDDDLHDIIARGGRRGQIYHDLRALRDKYGDLIRRRYPKIPRLVSGYNLDQLLPEKGFNVAGALVGTESTCAITLKAWLALHDAPKVKTMVVLGYDNIPAAADAVPFIMSFKPMACEFFSQHVLQNLDAHGMQFGGRDLLPEGKQFLIVEFASDSPEQAHEQAETFEKAIRGSAEVKGYRKYEDKSQEEAVWEIRRHSAGSSRMGIGVGIGSPGWPNWEDAAVDPNVLGDYMRDYLKLQSAFGLDGNIFGHFGQGCVHIRLSFDLRTNNGVSNFRRFMEEAADLVVSYGGSLSGEHGDGQGRAELLPKMFGEELITAFREFKAIWDPLDRMNPGMIVDPYPLDLNLREGVKYAPIQLETYFQYPEDKFTYTEATNRCFGVGKCRHLSGGTMCPSFMVTREEKHSTRGRSRLLQEMMRPDGPIEGRWQNEEVKEALDLCLACKGCKGDCPVNVDMATYKAEFLAHYYQRRKRPMSAYAMGLIPIWAPMGAQIPDLVNALTETPIVSDVLKAVGGIAHERAIPRFATVPFDRWWTHHPPKPPGDAGRVVLWADTFNTYFTPEVAIAATEVLQELGYTVEVPASRVCCGRPFYDYGFLPLARSYLRDAISRLKPYLRDGTPIVGLEPSCIAVFRDELLNMLPNDLDAQRLAQQTYTLAEFLEKRGGDWHWKVPQLHRKAIVQVHCHHKAVMKFKDEETVMQKIGLDVELPDSGCCGMAGSFGYEAGEHYTVSQACGERVILPKVRDASKETLIIADGFSCREQIEQGTPRQALHLAQVLRMAQQRGDRKSHDNGLARSTRLREYVYAAGIAALVTTPVVIGLVKGTAE